MHGTKIEPIFILKFCMTLFKKGSCFFTLLKIKLQRWRSSTQWQFLGKQYKCNYASVFALQARQSASFLYEKKEANMNDI